MSNPATPRPPLPAMGLPRAPRRPGPSVIVALIAHVVLIGALIWERTTYLASAMGGDGPQGGGGGGGAQLRYVALSPPAAPKAVATPRAPTTDVPLPVPQALKLPEPVQLEITPVVIAPQAVTIDGSGQVGGATSGSGGGAGTATGTGIGSQEGPGSGGGDGLLSPPDPRAMLFPPTCARGQFTVRFWVEVDGHVSRVEVDPVPQDTRCRRDFVAKMRGYKFHPAKTRDGRAVASVFTGTVAH